MDTQDTRSAPQDGAAVERALNAAANQVLAVVAPATSRLVQAAVTVAEDDTASTDGVHIWLPPAFEGVDVTQDAPVAIGLLAHELGHFLQPLAEVQQVEQETGAPHWLANILLDIQGEAQIACLFPPLAAALTAVRAAVGRNRLAEYVRALLAPGITFLQAACALALAGRFAHPDVPCAEGWYRAAAQAPAGAAIAAADWAAKADELLNWLGAAHWTAAKELPGLLRQIMAQFPELQTSPALTLPLGDPKVVARGTGQAVQAEAQGNTREREPIDRQERQELTVPPGPPEPEAVTIARAIRLRFAVPKGGVEVVAPGRLERREAARGDGIPFRLDLPGRSAPRPQVVICLDVSESMWTAQGKIRAARVAAQAIALAVRDAGGDVVGVLFDDTWLIDAGWGDTLLFAPAAWPTEGGTCFAFLADLWRRYPQHWVVLVTDGDGYVPYAAAPDRARTGAVVIPDGNRPNLGLAKMAEICNSVIVLKDPRDLPWALALLIPRAIVA
jgi:hypothetical protein